MAACAMAMNQMMENQKKMITTQKSKASKASIDGESDADNSDDDVDDDPHVPLWHEPCPRTLSDVVNQWDFPPIPS